MEEPSYLLSELIRADIDAARRHFGRAVTHAFPNVFVAVSHRFAHALDSTGLRWLAQPIAILCHVLTGAEIRPAASIGPGLAVVHPSGIVIGGDVVAGRDLSLWGSNTLGWSEDLGSETEGSPRLGDGVVLLTHSSVLGPVTIGDGVLVAAYALVLDDMPSKSRPRGIPARIP